MSDKELEEYLKTIKPNFDSHIEKGTIEMSNEYYNLLEERMIRLLNENKQLKQQLDYLISNEYLNQVKWERTFNEELVKDLQQRIDKAIEIIKREFLCYDNESDEYKWGKILIETLGDKENDEL